MPAKSQQRQHMHAFSQICLQFSFYILCCCLQVDSKKELEKQVKASCEAFIMAVTKLTVEPMLSFITKVTAVKVATSSSTSKKLREQVCSTSFQKSTNITIRQACMCHIQVAE